MSFWREVSVIAEAARAEALSDAFTEHGALCVSVEDADAGTPLEVAQFGEPGSPAQPLWARSRVVALFESDADLTDIVADSLRSAALSPATAVEIDEVAERDWVRLTQAEFAPIRVNEGLWIVPSWHQIPDAGAINIRLDPGMAFGTGSHPTTRLCLDWLCGQVGEGLSLLDYGCGSGILAIAAARLGAFPVVGTDIDPQAITAARENAAQNGVGIELRHSSEALDMRFDRVVANILTNPLCLLAPLLVARLKAGGRIALSGILESQAAQVREAYAAFITLEIGDTDEGWVRLEGTLA